MINTPVVQEHEERIEALEKRCETLRHAVLLCFKMLAEGEHPVVPLLEDELSGNGL